MLYEDQLIRESTGEYDGREQHWCSRCEREAEDCVCHDEFLADVPAGVRIALAVLLNHVEPGYENCKTLVSAWLKHIEHEGPR